MGRKEREEERKEGKGKGGREEEEKGIGKVQENEGGREEEKQGAGGHCQRDFLYSPFICSLFQVRTIRNVRFCRWHLCLR